MKLPIGFFADIPDEKAPSEACKPLCRKTAGIKSVVQVYFPEQSVTLAYYNDTFDLQRGDVVFVEGKLAGVRGHVTEVSHTFKIKLSDYKRVLSVADTHVQGRFYMAGSHFVTFDPITLPYEQVITWFRPPVSEDEFAVGADGTGFPLDDLSAMDIKDELARRGLDYYNRNKVRYLSVHRGRGRAIVEGSRPYELEFDFDADGRMVRNLVCTCPCSYTCKHAFAAMLQLRETLALIDRHYASEYGRTGSFSAVSKSLFFNLVLSRETPGSIHLE